MAGCACDVRMQTRQWEGSLAVIERYVGPLRGFVARAAVFAKLAVVRILRGMTGKTILGRALVNVIFMAGCACNRGVRTG